MLLVLINSGMHPIRKVMPSLYPNDMNRKLNPRQALQQLAMYLNHTDWSVGQQSLTGTLQDRHLKGRYFASGICVAITIAWPLAQASQACLLLAASPETLDDALYVEQQQFWLLRRYPPVLTEAEFDLLLQQQLAMAGLLTPPVRETHPGSPFIGRYA
ncbi:protein EsaB [Edwardsiella ictaluri]|uniref:protein EsaB n=1 Tax=Edwardsiella ictaluri TaxID=67780 RepID=UPI001E427274|nr:protein EsaB [Edwardsiella ictaluri]